MVGSAASPNLREGAEGRVDDLRRELVVERRVRDEEAVEHRAT